MHMKKHSLIKIFSIVFLISIISISFIVIQLFSHKEQQLKKINIAFQEWVGYGPFFLAQDKGFFKEEGIELEFIDEQLDSARRDAFKEGILDCEAGTLDILISKTAQDIPIQAIFEIDRSFGGDGIIAAENINSLKDLIGKKVAFARDDVGDILISYLFDKEGIPMNSITIIARSPEEVAQAFLDGEADAVVTWEPWLSKSLQRKGAHLLISTKDIPDIIVDTLNVRADIVKNDPTLIKGLMRAWFKALKYYKENPVEASTIIAKHYSITPAQYRKDVEKLRWTDYKEQNSPREWKEWASIFNEIADIKFKAGRITKKPDSEKILNTSLIKGIYSEDSH